MRKLDQPVVLSMAAFTGAPSMSSSDATPDTLDPDTTEALQQYADTSVNIPRQRADVPGDRKHVTRACVRCGLDKAKVSQPDQGFPDVALISSKVRWRYAMCQMCQEKHRLRLSNSSRWAQPPASETQN